MTERTRCQLSATWFAGFDYDLVMLQSQTQTIINQYCVVAFLRIAIGLSLYGEHVPMRLSQFQIDTLKRNATEAFGPNSCLILFGSRVDDNLRGGDIDLYVTGFNQSIDLQLEAKLHFLVKVKQALGEQRIDLVFAPSPEQTPLPIHRIAEKTGIPLCLIRRSSH